MVGQGALRECLEAADVESVLVVVRTPTAQRHPKLREVTHADMLDLSPIEGELGGYDVCLFCLGVSSAGMGEAEYTKLTHDLTLAVARVLVRVCPGMTFIYVSGASTDSKQANKLSLA